MIKPPSQQTKYTLIFSGDPALNLPTLEELATMAEPERAKAITERERKLDVARETGQWEPLLHQGQTPTLFQVRPVSGSLLDWMAGEINRNSMSTPEAAAFALRCALREVRGFGEHQVKLVRAGADDEHSIASHAIIDALYAVEGVGRDVVQELGGLVLLRAFGGLRPKS